MARIICLANSRKNQHRCIAGMTSFGNWIRPVSKLDDGSIRLKMRQIEGTEPKLLDILKLPLDQTGPDFGHQPENRLVLDGSWSRAGAVDVQEILLLCERRDVLLHTDADRVPEQLIKNLPPSKRYSLQLIRVANAAFHQRKTFKGKPQHRARFTYSKKTYDLVVTDPIAETRLAKGETINKNCILTVSMGGPYEENYFKFVAAVIEI